MSETAQCAGEAQAAGETLFRVRSGTSATELGSAIAHAVYDEKKVVLRAIGAAAVNQAVKALAIAEGYVASRGLMLLSRSAFFNAQLPDAKVSGVRMRVYAVHDVPA